MSPALANTQLAEEICDKAGKTFLKLQQEWNDLSFS